MPSSVPQHWSVPEHFDARVRLSVALDAASCAGAVVLGPNGVGKSTLARQAVDGYAGGHPDAVIRHVPGTPTERVVPFGAFSHLMDIDDIGKPAALLRAARLSLDAGKQDLFIVDDASELDALSRPRSINWHWPARPGCSSQPAPTSPRWRSAPSGMTSY